MMKKLLFLSLMASASLSYAQTTAGLLAHWDMNGTTSDVSGGGHNGHGSNLVAAAGKDGVMGHAWYFNGVNSAITMPYTPDLNVSGYTIYARLKVKGFYTGPCQGNPIFMRGSSNVTNGSYYVIMTDYPAGYGCTPDMDTTMESFVPNACGNPTALGAAYSGASFADFDQPSHVVEDVWYDVAATFNDTVFKVYINNVLATSVGSYAPGVAMGSSTDSASIGYAPYDAAVGYPYAFKGIMDDMRLYNRALGACELSKIFLGTNTLITNNPANDTAAIGDTAIYTITDTGGAATYQWQRSTEGGFINLSAASPYFGVTTKTLMITPVTALMSSYTYRCIRSAGPCVDTSTAGTLTVAPLGLSSIAIQNSISLTPNPAQHVLNITSPVAMDKIELYNLLGQKILSEYNKGEQATLNIDNLPHGIYILRINDTYSKKLTKE